MKIDLTYEEQKRSDRLNSFLQMAVFLEMERLRGLDPDELDRIGRAQVHHIAERADVTMFGGEGRGASGELARGLAALALIAPGGVDFNGLHFCDNHDECVEAAS